jgi:hypothetical protein
MATVLNIRGTNGSGKTTLARSFLAMHHEGGRSPDFDLVRFPSPTKRDPDRMGGVPGYGRAHDRTILVGPYHTACGGLDGIASFDRQRLSIRSAIRRGASYVVAEGVLASTVYGSWAAFDDAVSAAGNAFAWCYLDTPVEVCLARIRERQRAAGREREIKEGLVHDKVAAIARTRERAIADGRMVYDLPWEIAEDAIWSLVRGEGEHLRAS